MSKVKFSVFSDLHYREGDWNWASRRLEEILQRAKDENSRFIIHCGDFCHNVHTAKDILKRYNNFEIPTYHTMGNHDFEDTFTVSEVCEAYKMGEKNFYSFEIDGIKFISLDTNYFHNKEGKMCHYASSSVWEKCHQIELCISADQLEFLESELACATGTTVIFSHASPVRSDGITNKDELQKIIDRHSSIPVLWINGHYHRNNLTLNKNMAVLDLNSTTSDWVNVEHNAYPPELMAKFRLSNHSLLFEKPVHAVVTVSRDGEIIIDGMKGAMFMGITHEMTGNRSEDKCGLPCDASVLSAHFKIFTQI